MKSVLFALAALVLIIGAGALGAALPPWWEWFTPSARAQSSSGPNVNPLAGVWVVTTCGTLPAGVTLTANTQGFMTVNTSGSLCVNQ